MLKLVAGMSLVFLTLSTPAARAEDEATPPPGPSEEATVVPEALRGHMKPLGFGLGFGSLGFSFAGVGVHTFHSFATMNAAADLPAGSAASLLERTGRIHRLSVVLSAVRAVPIAVSLIETAGARDDVDRLRALGVPYLILGVHDLVSAGIAGTNAIRLHEDREENGLGWSSSADDVADAAIEAGGAWAGGMMAIGAAELIVGGLALHGFLRMQGAGSAARVVVVPSAGGAVIAGRF